MKVMISQTMAGKSIEQVRVEREALVERIRAAGHEYVDSVIATAPPENPNQALWYLGAALQILSGCGACVFMRGWDTARGCRIEHAAALAYGIEVWTENDLPEARK